MKKIVMVSFFWFIMVVAFPFTVWVIEILRHIKILPYWF